MYSPEKLKQLNEERVFIESLPWLLQILVKWVWLNLKRRAQ